MTEHARPARSDVPGRALLVVAIVGVIAAAGLAWLAFFGDDSPEATLVVSPVAVSTIPDTIPPTMVEPIVDATVSPTSKPATTVAPLSPLASRLGPRGSAAIRPAGERVLPASITIDALELWGPVRAVGLKDNGELQVPDETEVGWYQLGAAPGEPGATVLAAHVTWNGAVGPFFKLADLALGAEVRVQLSDDSMRIYEVVERAMYPKDGLPESRIFSQIGPESLVLITCGGSFNANIHRYRDNIVVYAVPVGSERAAGSASSTAATAPPSPEGEFGDW
jgi:hypothetical protein